MALQKPNSELHKWTDSTGVSVSLDFGKGSGDKNAQKAKKVSMNEMMIQKSMADSAGMQQQQQQPMMMQQQQPMMMQQQPGMMQQQPGMMQQQPMMMQQQQPMMMQQQPGMMQQQPMMMQQQPGMMMGMQQQPNMMMSSGGGMQSGMMAGGGGMQMGMGMQGQQGGGFKHFWTLFHGVLASQQSQSVDWLSAYFCSKLCSVD